MVGANQARRREGWRELAWAMGQKASTVQETQGKAGLGEGMRSLVSVGALSTLKKHKVSQCRGTTEGPQSAAGCIRAPWWELGAGTQTKLTMPPLLIKWVWDVFWHHLQFEDQVLGIMLGNILSIIR